MSFSNPFSIKTPGTSKIGASEINAAGVSISKAVDGTGGGSYSPVVKVQIGGEGLEFSDGGWPLLSARTITRIEATKIVPNRIWNDAKWGAEGDYIQYGECIQDGVPQTFFDGIVGGLTTWLEFFPLHGATLTGLSVTCARNNVGAPGTVTTAPSFRAKRLSVSDGTVNDLGLTSLSAFTTVYANDAVNLASAVVIDREVSRYFVAVNHPNIATNFCALLVRAVKATYSVSKMQL